MALEGAAPAPRRAGTALPRATPALRRATAAPLSCAYTGSSKGWAGSYWARRR